MKKMRKQDSEISRTNKRGKIISEIIISEIIYSYKILQNLLKLVDMFANKIIFQQIKETKREMTA